VIRQVRGWTPPAASDPTSLSGTCPPGGSTWSAQRPARPSPSAWHTCCAARPGSRRPAPPRARPWTGPPPDLPARHSAARTRVCLHRGARQAKRLSVAVPSPAPILKPVSAELRVSYRREICW